MSNNDRMNPSEHTVEDFLALVDKCKVELERDPTGYTAAGNQHLYELQDEIYLRLLIGCR